MTTDTLTPRVAKAEWRALGVTVALVLTDHRLLADARRLLADDLAAIDLAANRLRPDSELAEINAADGRPVPVSALLADALEVALHAAQSTDGAVDPTLGCVLDGLGYDRDFAAIPTDGPPPLTVGRCTGWRSVRLDPIARTVTVPAGVHLDLGATAKAFAADRAAQRLSDTLGCGVLVSLGGDVAVTGSAPPGGWAVRVQDRPGSVRVQPDGPAQTVAVRSGGLATSSTASRTWRRGGALQHHIIDPRTLLPAAGRWRTISVAGPTCVRANTISTAAIVAGPAALTLVRRTGLPARLVGHDGMVCTLNGWPPVPGATSSG